MFRINPAPHSREQMDLEVRVFGPLQGQERPFENSTSASTLMRHPLDKGEGKMSIFP